MIYMTRFENVTYERYKGRYLIITYVLDVLGFREGDWLRLILT